MVESVDVDARLEEDILEERINISVSSRMAPIPIEKLVPGKSYFIVTNDRDYLYKLPYPLVFLYISPLRVPVFKSLFAGPIDLDAATHDFYETHDPILVTFNERGPSLENVEGKKKMLKNQLLAMPPIGPFPGGTNYHKALQDYENTSRSGGYRKKSISKRRKRRNSRRKN